MAEPKDAVISIRLPSDLNARLIGAAEKLDLSKNDIARHAIRAAVAEIEANDYHITLPLEMSVRKDTPVRSTPGGVIARVERVFGPVIKAESLHTNETPSAAPPSAEPEGKVSYSRKKPSKKPRP